MIDWNDDGNEDFRDIPDEVNLDAYGNPVQAPVPQFNQQQRPTRPQQQYQPQPQQYEEFVEDISLDEDEEDYTATLSDARLRLEQGKLYELILNLNLSDIINDADPVAMKYVQRAIRRFAKESMEVMLGMRQTVPLNASNAPTVSQFNSLEVEILKKIASKATNGATEQENAEEVAQAIVKQAPPPPKGPSLKKPQQSPPAKKLTSAPSKPVQRQSQPTKQAPKKPSKDISEMTPDELMERNREISERQARNKAPRPQDALPMPDERQMQMLAERQVDSINMGSSNTISTLIALMDKKNNGQ